MIVRRAWPPDTVLLFDFLPGDTGVISDAALARTSQFVEDFSRILESKSTWTPQRTGQVLNNTPVLPSVSGRIDRLVDLDDATFNLRDGAFIFFLQ